MDLILPILCRTSFLKRTKWPPCDGDDVRQWIFWQRFLIKSELVDTGWIVDFSLYNNARYKASHHNFFLPSVYCTFNPLFIQLLYTSKSTIGLTKVVLIQMWASHPFTSNDCFKEFDLWSFHHHSLGDIRGITFHLQGDLSQSHLVPYMTRGHTQSQCLIYSLINKDCTSYKLISYPGSYVVRST